MEERGGERPDGSTPGRTIARYLAWARTPRSERTRITATALVGPVFLGILPLLVVRAGPSLDRRLGVRPLGAGSVLRVLGAVLAVLGFGLGLWSVETQLGRGRGTPLPMMPTQQLLAEGPYRACRNPMTLGAILAYLGLALAARTPSGVLTVVTMASTLLAYLKAVEERELEARFGAAYVAYRQATPFIVPRRLAGRSSPAGS